jgi:hypothetical protein
MVVAGRRSHMVANRAVATTRAASNGKTLFGLLFTKQYGL